MRCLWALRARVFNKKTIAGCDRTVRIPMAHGVDSLNVAAASAVAFWQLCPHVDNGYTYKPGMFA